MLAAVIYEADAAEKHLHRLWHRYLIDLLVSLHGENH